MGKIIGFVTTWWKFAVALIAVASASFLLGQCDGRKSERVAAENRQKTAVIKALEVDRKAREKADAQHLADQKRNIESEKGLKDAIHKGPDSNPDAARIRLNCERLRRQQRNGSPELPKACGPRG